MKHYFLILFIVLSNFTYSQENFFTSGDPFGFRTTKETFFNSGNPFNFKNRNQKFKQDSSKFIQPAIAVNVGLLPLIGYFPTFQLGFEHKVSNQINFHYEWGHVLGSRNDEKLHSKSGYRIRFEPRYYFQNKNGQAIYTSIELFFNHLKDKKTETVGFNCPDGQCDYYQYATYTNLYDDYGALIKIGSMYELYSVKGMFIDLNVGFGFRDRSAYSRDKPTGSSSIIYDGVDGFEPNFEDYSGLHMNISFRLGYRFK